MSQTDSIWVKVQLNFSPEKFYGFFRNHLEDLVHLFPENYESLYLVEGEDYSAGSVIFTQYEVPEGPLVTMKYLVRVVDDVKKYIIYEAVEGDELKHYKVFRVKLEVVNGGGTTFAQWTVDFEKANENVPTPKNYLELFVKISNGIDTYISKN